MKHLRLVMILGYALLAGCSTIKKVGTADKTKKADLIVMSYNIHHANPPSKPGVIDLAAIAAVINQHHPDLVALQEVDVYTNRSGYTVNEATELAKLTGLTAYFAKAIDYDGGEYGVAILSKFPMEQMHNSALPTDPSTSGEPRTLASVTVTLPGNRKIVFACTHLDAQGKDTNRQLQIKKLLKVLHLETLPVIVAGDFNAIPTSDIISQLDTHFTRTCKTGCPYTIPEIKPVKTIDYIAYTPAAGMDVVLHTVVDESYASDHRPVIAGFKF